MKIAKEYPFQIIACLALSLRIVYLAFFGDPFSGPDADTYSSVAERVLIDGPFAAAPQIPYWPIGYPWFLATILLLADGNYILVSIIQSVIFSIAVYCYCALLSSFLGKRICTYSGLLLAVNPALLTASTQLMYETTQIAMVMIGFFLLNCCFRYKKSIFAFGFLALLSLCFFVFASIMQLKVITVFVIALLLTLMNKKLFDSPRTSRLVVTMVLIFAIVLPPTTILIRNIQAGDGVGISKNYQVHVKFGLEEAGIEQTCENPSKYGYDDIRFISCMQFQKLKQPHKGLYSIAKQFFDLMAPYVGPLRKLENVSSTWFHGVDFRRVLSLIDETSFLEFWKSVDLVLSILYMIVFLFVMFVGVVFSTRFEPLSTQIGVRFLRYSLLASAAVPLVGDGDNRYRLTLIPLYLPFLVVGFSRIHRAFFRLPKGAIGR